ncbi:hypothetical protein N7499_007673 [Penicillium canescens]|nr:hypothetical protein N7499_007673 [Penicillium canescens]KAJ6158005.1 hypothetical protein N7485_010831 [Penicillium canescens]
MTQGIRPGRGSEELDGGGRVGVKDLIAHHTGAGPLGLQFSLRPQHAPLRGRKPLLQHLGAVCFQSAVAWHPETATPEG